MMRWLTLLKSELKRLIGLRTYLIFIIIMSAAAIYGIYYDLDLITPQKVYITVASTLLGSAKASAVIGSISFAVFTILEMNRDRKTGTVLIVSSYMDYLYIYIPRLIPIIIIGIISTSISALSCFIALRESILENDLIPLLLLSYAFVTFAAVLFTLIICCGLYIICQRVELSMILYMALLYVSLSIKKNYLLNWIQTNVVNYSDSFGNAGAIKLILWNRLLWLLVSLVVFIFGLLFTRRYGYGMLKSFLHNIKKSIVPVLLCVLIPVTLMVYIKEPLFTKAQSPETQQFQQYERLSRGQKRTTVYDSICSQTDNDKYMKILSFYPSIHINTQNGSLTGQTELIVQKMKDGKGHFCFKLERGITIDNILVNGKKEKWQILSEDIYAVEIPDETKLELVIYYSGTPANLGYLDQGSPDYIISKKYIYLSNEACIPIPCFYEIGGTGYMKFKASTLDFKSSITLPKEYTLVTTGETERTDNSVNGLNIWESDFVMENKPYITINASTEYNMSRYKLDDKNLEMYFPKNKSGKSTFKADEIATSAMKYFTKWFGSSAMKFSTLKLVERHVNEDISVSDTNVVYLDESIFTKAKLEYGDKQKVMEIYNLVSQICRIWWGDVTLSFSERLNSSQSKDELFSAVFPEDTWGSSQLVEYCTYQYILDTYGASYAKHIENLWKSSTLDVINNFYYQNPRYLNVVPESFIDEVITDINEARFIRMVPLKMLITARQNGENWMKKKISVLAKEYTKTRNYNLFVDALNYTKGINIGKGELKLE